MNLIFLGPPGVGKGTQAAKVAVKFNLIHLSTGELLREAINAQTELGKKADEYLAHGDLVPDDLIIGLIENIITSGNLLDGFIFDGFPRTIPQAESLKMMLADNSTKIDHTVLLKVSDDTIVERLKGRAEIESRSDDTEEVVRKRLKIYDEQTRPLEQFYREESLIREIDGEASLEEVFNRIVDTISQ